MKVLFVNQAISQSARLLGMGGYSDAIEDASQVFRNPALSASSKSTVFQATIEDHYGFRELINRSITATTPISIFQTGIGASLFGVPQFQNSIFSGVVSIRASKKSRIGIRAAWYQTHIPASMNANITVPLLGAGWYAQPFDMWSFGMQVSVFSKKIYQMVPRNLEPSMLSAACSWHPIETFKLTLGLETNHYEGFHVRSGLEWRAAKVLALRTGVIGNPMDVYFGLGIYYNSFVFDLSAAHHQVLGYSPSVSLSYSL